VQIKVECSECGNTYQLQSENIGKKMRCTNPTCQTIFEIREVNTAAPSSPPLPPVQTASTRNAGARAETGYQTGNVGDIVPVLEAEVILDAFDVTDDEELIQDLDLDVDTAPPKKKEPKEVAWSDGTPPPKELDWDEEATTPPTSKKSKKKAPVVVVDDDPPPRRSYDDDDEEDLVGARASARTRRKQRRGKIAFVLLTAMVLGVGGYATVRLLDIFTKTEEKAFADAKGLYTEHKYPEAETQFIALIKKYPESNQIAEYTFLQKMANLRKSVYSVVNASEPKQSMELIILFETEHAADEQMKPDAYAIDFYETIQKEIEDVIVFADKQSQAKKYDDSDAALADVETLLPLLAKYQPEGVTPPAFATDTERIALVNSGARKRLVALAEMRKLAADPTDENLDRIREIITDFNLRKDGEAIIIWDMARKNAQLLVRYFADKPPVPASAAPEGNLPGLLLVPIIERGLNIPAGSAAPSATNSVFFALARGVLYALDEWDGRVLWATRVGIDVDTLPLRVPASDLNPELVLIPFNDGKQFGLSARLARTGQMLWHQPFDTPILGRPVLVGQRAFVPTRDEKGTISVLEITNGSRLGRIQTNHRLGVGGAKQPDKGILFFPADSAQVFVFDVEKHDEAGLRLDPFCLGVVSTGHPSRSLRCPALVIGDDQQNMRPSLLLMQADGLDGMLLRSYTLPPEGAAIPWPVIVPIDVRLNGWTWFEPFSDGEKLAMVTERGEFGLYGIHQPGNQDPPLFPLPAKSYRIDGTGLIEIRDNDPNVTPSLQSRGQVVYADENRYWVIAAGYLHQLDLGLTALEGPKLVQPRRPIPIGTPLHEGQVNSRRDIAVMVTQSTTGSACVATAIDLHTGKVRWMRQLGAIVQSESMSLADGTVTLDQAGGLFWFPKFTKPIPPEV